MGTKSNKLDELRDRQPFRVPEGYFERFSEDFMSRLPEKTMSESKPKDISLYDRVKPWLYMAAAFVGIIVLFNVFNKTAEITSQDGNNVTAKTSPLNNTSEADDNADFLEYIEDMYVDKYAISYIYDDFMDN
ncbi:MAG: hypothetical protein LBV74_18580 [Tannerella sp.]|jgi:hypothetical protein|nr:hypothetical protein [Tannerella sp.]